VDQPLSVTRYEYRSQPGQSEALLTWPRFGWILFWDYRGAPSYGLFSDGTWAKPHTLAPGQSSCPLVGPNRCVVFQWPLAQSAWDRNRGKVAFPAWHGTLFESKRDGSGLEYARNRLYDPATGRFSQEDPIGLAGGLNAYGFADGDPVNVGDPFGLCEEKRRDAKGLCPGGLSVREWQVVEAAIGTISHRPVRSVLGNMLKEGKITPAEELVSEGVHAYMGTNLYTGTVSVSRGKSMGSAKAFDLPAADFAWALSHELGHIGQFQGRTRAEVRSMLQSYNRDYSYRVCPEFS
jgi:RHS repeat-associated protein